MLRYASRVLLVRVHHLPTSFIAGHLKHLLGLFYEIERCVTPLPAHVYTLALKEAGLDVGWEGSRVISIFPEVFAVAGALWVLYSTRRKNENYTYLQKLQ